MRIYVIILPRLGWMLWAKARSLHDVLILKMHLVPLVTAAASAAATAAANAAGAVAAAATHFAAAAAAADDSLMIPCRLAS